MDLRRSTSPNSGREAIGILSASRQHETLYFSTIAANRGSEGARGICWLTSFPWIISLALNKH